MEVHRRKETCARSQQRLVLGAGWMHLGSSVHHLPSLLSETHGGSKAQHGGLQGCVAGRFMWIWLGA